MSLVIGEAVEKIFLVIQSDFLKITSTSLWFSVALKNLEMKSVCICFFIFLSLIGRNLIFDNEDFTRKNIFFSLTGNQRNIT